MSTGTTNVYEHVTGADQGSAVGCGVATLILPHSVTAVVAVLPCRKTIQESHNQLSNIANIAARLVFIVATSDFIVARSVFMSAISALTVAISA